MLHRLCGPPSIHLSFNLAAVLPRRSIYRVSYKTHCIKQQVYNRHRLRRGLPGYLILFAPHAFAPQRQFLARESPSPLVFLPNSTHFPLLQILLPLKNSSLPVLTRSQVKPDLCGLSKPPTCPLHPVIPINSPSVLPRLLARS